MTAWRATAIGSFGVFEAKAGSRDDGTGIYNTAAPVWQRCQDQWRRQGGGDGGMFGVGVLDEGGGLCLDRRASDGGWNIAGPRDDSEGSQ